MVGAKYGIVTSIFLPGIGPNNFLGMPGFYLTRRDGLNATEEAYPLKIYGPKGISQVLESSVYFIGKLTSKFFLIIVSLEPNRRLQSVNNA